jgi:hypothetical protein
MAHLGWIFPVAGVVGGYIGGILTMLYGHVGKYSLDRANELKELIVLTRRSISSFENHTMFNPQSVASDLSNDASGLKSKLELIRWYGLIRCLHLVPLPPKRNIYKAAELLPRLSGGVKPFGNPQIREEAPFLAKKIKDLLA